MGVLFTPEQLAQMSAEEIQAALDEKPFALMCRDIAAVRRLCKVSQLSLIHI